MDSSTGNFIDVSDRPISGLETKSSNPAGAVRENKPDPVRVAIFLEAVDAWWESRSVSTETIIPIGGGE